jgi:hypothetical protein
MIFFVLALCDMQRKSSTTLDILMTISTAATPQGKGYLRVVLGPTHPYTVYSYYAISLHPPNSAPAISLGSFGKRNFMQPMGRLSMHSWMVQFFFLEQTGDRDFFFPCSHQVSKGFSSSQNVPTCISQDVPNSTWVLSHIVCPKFNSRVNKLERWNLGEPIFFLFCN